MTAKAATPAASIPPCQEGKCITRVIVYGTLTVLLAGGTWAVDRLSGIVDRIAKIETAVARLEVQVNGAADNIREIKEAVRPSPKVAAVSSSGAHMAE